MHTHKRKTKQGNSYHLDNNKKSTAAITPNIMQREKNIDISILNTINILIVKKVPL
jgi:hypothetical protein